MDEANIAIFPATNTIKLFIFGFSLTFYPKEFSVTIESIKFKVFEGLAVHSLPTSSHISANFWSHVAHASS